LAAEKGQLKSVLISGFRIQIARVIPPLGAIARVVAVVFGEFEIAGTGDGKIIRFVLSENRLADCYNR
jgi:hypothetical protein